LSHNREAGVTRASELPVAILAGGLATRLRPLTETIPKSLVEVAGEPFLAHQLRLLSQRGIQRAVLCLGHLGEQIRDWAGDGGRFGLRLDYSFDGPVLRGTGGALRQALPLLGERFLVLYGDSYLPCDYQAVGAAFLASGRLGLMTVFRNEGQWDTSNVQYENGEILVYDKRHRTPEMHYIDYGLGALHRAAFEGWPPGAAFDLAEIYQALVRSGQLAAFEVAHRFYEIGSVQGIAELTDYLRADRNVGGAS
jgi:NDP-sugar pyrophosphorylase family protein